MRIEELKGKTVSEARVELENRTVSELKAVCKEHGAKGYSGATKMQLVDKIIDIAAYDMWLLKLGTGRIEGNNVWIEYADGTTEVISGEIPATAQPVKNKPHYVFEIGKKYAGKLNGMPTVFTVEDYEEDVIALTAANGEFHSCIVGYFIEGAFGKSDTVTERNRKWTVSVTARDIVEEQPAEEVQVKTIPVPAQSEDANFSKEIIKLLLESLAEHKAETDSQPKALYEDEVFSDALGDNSQQDQDIPEAHTAEEEEITAMLNKYTEISGTIRVIKEGVTEIRKGIKMLEKQGLPYDGLLSVIEGAKDEYHNLRREGFLLWRKLLRVMSVLEIRRACETFMARYEEEKRRHMRV